MPHQPIATRFLCQHSRAVENRPFPLLSAFRAFANRSFRVPPQEPAPVIRTSPCKFFFGLRYRSKATGPSQHRNSNPEKYLNICPQAHLAGRSNNDKPNRLPPNRTGQLSFSFQRLTGGLTELARRWWVLEFNRFRHANTHCTRPEAAIVIFGRIQLCATFLGRSRERRPLEKWLIFTFTFGRPVCQRFQREERGKNDVCQQRCRISARVGVVDVLTFAITGVRDRSGQWCGKKELKICVS